MKAFYVIVVFVVFMAATMVCLFTMWTPLWRVWSRREDATHLPNANEANPKDKWLHETSTFSPPRAAVQTSDTNRNYKSETSSFSGASEEKVSWENCRHCPSVTQQKTGATWTVVCKGSETNLTVHPKQSFVDLSPQECSSICSCPLCETCGVKTKPFQSHERVGGKVFRHFRGSSGYILLLINDSHGTTYVAKIGRDKRSKRDTTNEYLLIAQQMVRDECGFEDIIPREQIGPLKASFEGNSSNYIASEQVIFSERFLGREIEKIAPKLLKGMNGTQLTLAALHDYLIGDRRALHNALLQSGGKIKLIDNHVECMQRMANSIFVPGTGFWSEKKVYTRRLDYRCSIPGGLLQKNYPSSVQRCLVSMSKSTVEELANKFGLTTTMASHFHERIIWMLEGGFEYAISKSLEKYRWKISFGQNNELRLPGPSC